MKNFVFIMLLTCLMWAKGFAQETKRPNIVWLTSEDNSVHYMKLYSEDGVATPHIESLADQGLVFNHAFSNAAVCSAARSTIISGVYGPKIASHYHRRQAKVPMPEGLKMFPAYLRQTGYYTSNNSKEDYNIYKSDDVWDNSSNKASWRNRSEGQPFFHVQNFAVTHEGSMHFKHNAFEEENTDFDQTNATIQPNHPQTELFRYSNARYRDQISKLDNQIGSFISKLEADGLMDDTFIFYFGDHGGVLPGSKGYLYETGLHVPMVVYVPKNFRHLVDLDAGTRLDGFVSFVDLAPTVLNLAGVRLPDGLDGQSFLGKGVDMEEMNQRDETYSYADRFDEKYDMVRAVRKGNYKYIRNYQRFNIDGLYNQYRYKQLGYQQWLEKFEKGELNEAQSAFFMPRQVELLYNVEDDPYEVNNLAEKQEYSKVLKQMRVLLKEKENDLHDLSFYPEYYLIQHAFENPEAFGQMNSKEIKRLASIADLQLLSISKSHKKLSKALASDNPWERYWALIVCSSYMKKIPQLLPVIKAIANNDNLLINKVRAAEYLAIVGEQAPQKVMTEALYASQDVTEAMLILNSMALMKSPAFDYVFNLDDSKIRVLSEEKKLIKELMKRVNYLKNN
ncbi:sulfatase family protein [Carboxylicivirga marina]|uniref:sulfatase family protein n=2 Tax=Carboxylicivirga TaxID=1628153 RepID=UPI002593788F|nr:sulfatase [uncultured Carboxylicivirga sp.]